MWLAIPGKLNTADVLGHKGIHYSLVCSLCHSYDDESIIHLFLTCLYTFFYLEGDLERTECAYFSL